MRAVMGRIEASVTVAAILQRATEIRTSGDNLRDLTLKAEEGRFSLAPTLERAPK